MLDKIVKKIKARQKHYLRFRKAEFNIKATDIDFQCQLISDSFILCKAGEAAAAHDCRLLSYKKIDYLLEGRMIEIAGEKEDYIKFCIAFGEKMGSYIKDIEF